MQSFGRISLIRGGQSLTRSVGCFPAIGLAPSLTDIFGVRYAYQPKSKQQKKSDLVPSHRIGVTKSWDSQHTGASNYLKDATQLNKYINGILQVCQTMPE